MQAQKILHVAAFEFYQRDGSMRPAFRYMHATDSRSAEVSFRRSHQQSLMTGRARIVGVAPVIGYHVDDEHGEKLHA